MKKLLLLLSLVFCFLLSIGQSGDFTLGKICIKLNSNNPNAIVDYDSTYSDFVYSTISDFDSIAQVAQVYKIEKTFKVLGPQSNRLNNILSIYFSNTLYTDSLISFLSQCDEIVYAQKEPIYYPHISAGDSLYNSTIQWNLYKVLAEDAWDITQGKKNIKIAIIDDAFLLNHEELKYKIWVNQGELPQSILSNSTYMTDDIIDVSELMDYYNISNDIDSLFFETTLFNGIDDDGNQFIDDVLGWDATYSGDSNVNPPSSVTSTHFSHGSHCSGIACAETTSSGINGKGIASIGWNVSLIPIKSKNDDACDTCGFSATKKGIEYAIAAGADIISMSYGGVYYDSTYESVIQEAYDAGIVLVASVGNDGLIPNKDDIRHFPAAYDNVISVGATDNQDKKTDFSCFSSNQYKWVEVMAPGDDIRSCLATGTNIYGNKDGTSQAAPLVAGISALMKSYCPSCSVDQIASCLYSTCDSMTSEPLYHSYFDSSYVGYGRVNAYNAITCLSDYSPMADFETMQEFICSNCTINMVDLSTGYITSWLWSSSNSNVTFSDSTDQNPIIFVNLSLGSSFNITLTVYNDSTSTNSQTTNTYYITQPQAEISYPATTLESCNDNETFFQVDFTNSNPPYSISYSDNFGNTYNENDIWYNPSIVNVAPFSDTTTVYTLTSMTDDTDCSGTVSGFATFISEMCDCYSVLRNNNWVFGDNVGLQFEPTLSSPYPGVYAIPGMVGNEASAAISDSNGDLMFYSDGEEVFNNTISLMENGGNLEGNFSSTQGALIIPKSMIDSTYYLFTIAMEGTSLSATESLWYHIIDMTEAGGSAGSPLGKVVLKNQAIPTNGIVVTEKMTWVKHDTIPNTYWLITHSQINNYWFKHLVSPDSVYLHSVDTTGSIITSNKGPVKSNLKGDILAAGFSFPIITELYSFNNLSGEIDSLDTKLNNSSYNLEFSPNSGYLFTRSSAHTITKYTVSYSPITNLPFLSNTTLELTTQEGIKGLQLSPDHSKILIGYYTSSGCFTTPNNQNSTYVPILYDYPTNILGSFSYHQLVPSNKMDLIIQDISHECNSGDNGSATVSAFSSCTPITYQWNDPLSQTGVTASGLSAGTYTVIATDACGCTSSIEVEIYESLLSILSYSTSPGCPDSSNAYINITVEPTTQNETYVWSNGDITQDIYNVMPGIYTVTITDIIGCEIIGTFDTGQPLEVQGNVQDITCFGLSDGLIDLTVNNGVSPYTFIWDTGAITEDLVYLSAGTYQVTITDTFGCYVIENFSLINPTPLNLSAVVQNITCPGACTGVIDLSVTGGTPSYSYLWSDSSITQDINNLCVGSYYVTVSDTNNCSIDSVFVITEPDKEYSLEYDSMACGCYGEATISATYPFYQYLWFNGSDSTFVGSLCPDSIYTVFVEDTVNMCSFTDTILIDYYPYDIPVVFESTEYCGCLNELYLLYPDSTFWPYDFEWSTGDTTQNLDSVCPGNFWVTITSQQYELCIDTAYYYLEDTASLYIVTFDVLNPTCISSFDGSLKFHLQDSANTGDEPNFPYYVTVQNDSTIIYEDTITTGNYPDVVSNLTIGNYYINIYDVNGCFVTDTVTLEPGYELEVTLDISSYCNSVFGGSAEITYTNAYVPYFTTWSNGEINTNSIDSLPLGQYFFTLTDDDGCLYVDSFTIDSTSITISGVSTLDNNCPYDGGSAWVDSILMGNPDYVYEWYTYNNPNDYYLMSSSDTASNLYPGLYEVIVTDASQCVDSFEFVISSYDPVMIEIINSTCPEVSNGSAWFDISTLNMQTQPMSISWGFISGNVFATQVDSVYNLSSGWYYLQIIDSTDCESYTLFEIDNDYVLDFDSFNITNEICEQGCNGEIDISMSNGFPWFEYHISGSSPQSSTDSIFNFNWLCPGTYTVTVTDTNGCVVITDAIIAQADSLNSVYNLDFATITINDEYCEQACNGEIDVVMANGYPWFEYQITGDTAQTSPNNSFNFDALCPGTYTITVTDTNNCTVVSDVLNIYEADTFYVEYEITANNCTQSINYTITLDVTGTASPFSYLWDTGAVSDSITVNSDGTYSVTVTDNNGCEIVESIIVEPVSLINVVITGVDPTCPDPFNGVMSVSVTGGVSPYNYLWSTNDTTDQIDSLPPNIFYEITVTDYYGCYIVDENQLTTSSLPNIVSEIIEPVCLDSASGSINIDIIGGDTGYSYSWTEEGTFFSSDQDIDSLISGYVYSLTATGINDNCLLTFTDTIPQEGDLGLIFTITGQTCDTDSGSVLMNADGKISVAIIGGSGQFTYLWSTGDTTSYVSGLTDSTIISVEVYDEDSICYGTATDSIWWQQDISFINTWSVMSTYLTPYNNDSILECLEKDGIAQEVIIVKDASGSAIWPLWGLDAIGTFTYNEGYQIKVNSLLTFEMKGHLVCPEDNPITLDTISDLWHIMSYLRTTPKDIEVCLAEPLSTQSIEIVKNGVGNVLWPPWGLNNIVNMIPGEGYDIKIIDNISFYYPANDTTQGTKSGIYNNKVFKYFTDLYVNTDNFMIVGIPESSWDIIPDYGDEIAAIGEHGQVVGRTIFEGGFSAIVLYGDDIYTEDINEGLDENEQFVLQIWNSSTKSTRSMEIKSWQKGDGYFSHQKISVAGVPNDEILDQETSSTFAISIYPNPGTGYYYIEILSTIETTIKMKVFNNTGQEIFQSKNFKILKGINKTSLDLLSQEAGNYIIQVTDGVNIEQAKLILIK